MLFKRRPKRPSSQKVKKKKQLPKAKSPKKRIKVKWDYQAPKYVEWRSSVYKRDVFSCRVCGKKGVYIEAHHIKKKAKFPTLAFVVSNGITLCKNCHDIVTNREQYFEILFKSIIKSGNRDYDKIRGEFIECLKKSM